MKTKKNKTFDCIAMKREAQKAIRAKVQGMTREEEAAFFHEGREEFGKEEKIPVLEEPTSSPGQSTEKRDYSALTHIAGQDLIDPEVYKDLRAASMI
jgi:hypothetical protein